MINIETIKFVRMLDELASKSKYGIEEFCNATEKNFSQKVFYAECFDYKVVLDARLVDEKECYHLDIVSFCEDAEYVVNVRFDESDSAPYLIVTLFGSDEQIVVENGKWYFA